MHKINLQERIISLFQVQVLWEWVIKITIGITIGLACLLDILPILGHALLQESSAFVKHMSDNYLIILSL